MGFGEGVFVGAIIVIVALALIVFGIFLGSKA